MSSPPPPPPPPPPPFRPTNEQINTPSSSPPPPPPPPPQPSSSSSSSHLPHMKYSPQKLVQHQDVIEKEYSNLEQEEETFDSNSSNKLVKDVDTSTTTSITDTNEQTNQSLPNLKHASKLLSKSSPNENQTSLSATSSMSSSPRRPRRMATGIPNVSNYSSNMEFEATEGLGKHVAHDDFEEQFLNHSSNDQENQIINDTLKNVTFRHLSDDEEVFSDDDNNNNTTKDQKEQSFDQSEHNWDTVDLQRIRQSTVKSNWRRIPSEVGCEDCEGCERLCLENRKLRRQLDELEFELASGVLHNPADGFEPPDQVTRLHSIPQIPISTKKRKGWTSRFRHSTASQLSNGKSANRSERERLKDEVQALTVTTEYLWRKLNKAEMELRNYRRKELQDRMRLNAHLRAGPSGTQY